VFPYAAAVNRSTDVDHTIPYLSPDRRWAAPGNRGWATSDPMCGGITGRKRMAAGESGNPNSARRDIYDQLLAAIVGATRSALAAMVRAGLSAAEDGKKLLSTT
jgi:hypothetical protein